MSDAARRRLFFALYPDAELRKALHEVARRHLTGAQGRLVAVDNIHLTLAFLGPVDEATRHCAEDVAAGLAGDPFEVVLERLGHWPRPRVLWSAPGSVPAELTRLVEALHEGLALCGVALERRRFRPHLTLARKVARSVETSMHPPLHWRVDHWVLMESRTLSDGVRYEALASWALTDGR